MIMYSWSVKTFCNVFNSMLTIVVHVAAASYSVHFFQCDDPNVYFFQYDDPNATVSSILEELRKFVSTFNLAFILFHY